MVKQRLFSFLALVLLIAMGVNAATVNLTTRTSSGTLTLINGDVLTGTLPSNKNYQIRIASGATVTLDNVTINQTSSTSHEYAGIVCQGNATIKLKGTNTVNGRYTGRSGIYVPEGSTLTIQEVEEGASLSATGKAYAAGIGAGQGQACGNIVINSGIVTATGGDRAAGIGAGYKTNTLINQGSSCGDITINGGTVTATGGSQSAGIGGSYNDAILITSGTCGNITINGGTVIATSGNDAAGIGGGYLDSTLAPGSSCGAITINGGDITATGSGQGNGIGGGRNSNSGHITINEGVNSLTAKGGNNISAKNIATNSSSSTVTIKGETIPGGVPKDDNNPFVLTYSVEWADETVDEAHWTIDPEEDEADETITLTYTGTKTVKSIVEVLEDGSTETPVTVTAGADENTWTLTLPTRDVTLEVEYYEPDVYFYGAEIDNWDHLTINLDDAEVDQTDFQEVEDGYMLENLDPGQTITLIADEGYKVVDARVVRYIPDNRRSSRRAIDLNIEVIRNEVDGSVSFVIPADIEDADVEVCYLVTRDMEVDVTAEVTNEKEEVIPRFLVMKTGVEGKYFPREYKLKDLPNILIVQDVIDVVDEGDEPFLMTLGTHYTVKVADENGDPILDDELNPIALADFDFAPGFYRLIIVGNNENGYDGETLTNVFELYEGYELQLPARGFATFYNSKYNLTTEDPDAALYTIAGVTDTEVLLSDEITVAPAGTPLIVYNKANKPIKVLIVPTDDDADEGVDLLPVGENYLFYGVDEDTEADASDEETNFYVLYNGRFVWVKDAGTLPAQRCALAIVKSASTAARRVVFGKDEATGISEVAGSVAIEGAYYDLQGRQLNAKPAAKGIYIMNGKKMMVK